MNPDVELIAKSIARDERAFGELFDRHSTAVFRFAYSLTHDNTEAQELVQTTFITAWRKLADIRLAGDSLLPWLIVTTRNHASDARRHNARKGTLPLEDHLTNSTHVRDIERSEHREELASVFEAVRKLDDVDQQIVQLCLYEGLSYKDAAKRLGITPGALGKRLERTRSRLRSSRDEEGRVTR